MKHEIGVRHLNQAAAGGREREALQTSLDAVSAEYHAVLSSRAWRATAWLRWLSGKMRALLRGRN